RSKQALGRRAVVRLALLGLAAGGLGGVGLALSPAMASGFALTVVVPVAGLVALLARGGKRPGQSTLYQVVAAIALPRASTPVLVAAGAEPWTAAALWLGWATGFGSTVLAVHLVLAHHRKRAEAVARRLTAAALVAVPTLGGLLAYLLGAPPALTGAPLVVAAVAVAVIRPPRTRLRTVGVALTCAATLGVLVASVLVTV